MALENFNIERLSLEEDIHTAFTLAENVFMEFEAPYFSKRGTDSFLSFLWGKRMREMLNDEEMIVWGCRCGSEIVGMLALRNGTHISLAFVNGKFHRQGIGRALFYEAEKYALSQEASEITVNASDYGIPFYKAMGFVPTDMQTEYDGIISTPMKKHLRRR